MHVSPVIHSTGHSVEMSFSTNPSPTEWKIIINGFQLLFWYIYHWFLPLPAGSVGHCWLYKLIIFVPILMLNDFVIIFAPFHGLVLFCLADTLLAVDSRCVSPVVAKAGCFMSSPRAGIKTINYQVWTTHSQYSNGISGWTSGALCELGWLSFNVDHCRQVVCFGPCNVVRSIIRVVIAIKYTVITCDQDVVSA